MCSGPADRKLVMLDRYLVVNHWDFCKCGFHTVDVMVRGSLRAFWYQSITVVLPHPCWWPCESRNDHSLPLSNGCLQLCNALFPKQVWGTCCLRLWAQWTLAWIAAEMIYLIILKQVLSSECSEGLCCFCPLKTASTVIYFNPSSIFLPSHASSFYK